MAKGAEEDHNKIRSYCNRHTCRLISRKQPFSFCIDMVLYALFENNVVVQNVLCHSDVQIVITVFQTSPTGALKDRVN